MHTAHEGARRILVIDDNEAIHEDFAKTFGIRTIGPDLASDEAVLFGHAPTERLHPMFEIDTALQGQHGLARVQAAVSEGRPYQLAFVDMRMPPGWDGVETITHLWKADPALQVVICTAYADYSWDQIVRKLGATDRLLILKKPFDDAEVRQIAAAMTEKWVVTREAGIKMSEMESLVEQRTAELRDVALRDTLTGLPNRKFFHSVLSRTIDVHQRDPRWAFAVLFIDVDRFKVVNDSLGHHVGDELLVAIADRLRDELRGADVLAHVLDGTTARVGGDEFLVLLDGLAHAYDAARVAERLLHVIAEPYEFRGHRVQVTASIGVTTNALAYATPDEMIRDADIAMYRAKTAGKAQFVVFDQRMHEDALVRLTVEHDLRRAITEGQFYLDYQPIVRLDTRRVCGFEALVRWQHPERGTVMPLDFIPLAEESGGIVPIGEWVLEEACRTLAAWRLLPGAEHLFVSVNLSRKQFGVPDLANRLHAIITRTGLPPEAIKLEITESVVLDGMEHALSVMRQIRDLGIELHLDDFGTGYSSLSCLHRFPIAGLKIDRSFAKNVADSRYDAAVVTAVVALARDLQIALVVEGVETPEQLSMLRAMGCELAQGYLFHRPMSAEPALAFAIGPPAPAPESFTS